ncbi:hypothetical protein SELMODRAFT_425760 [Selaginella moellendorffii]|uniref:Uncharacterized protein n=1 Tax=Selaginella moellendorffii TaxID=88036 RepID=D8SU73_SELML|nr:hypothetical protein SELMODRAFT_425760 [Selaginella moellendorffii]
MTKSVSTKLRWVRLLVWSVGYIDSVGVNFQDLSYDEEQLKNGLLRADPYKSPRLRQQAADHSRPALGTLLDEITTAEVPFVLDLAMSADWHQLSSVTAMDVYKSTPDLTKSQELQRLGHRWRKKKLLEMIRRLIVCSTSKHDLERVLAWAEYGLMNWLSEIYRAIQGAGPREWLAALYSAGVPCAVASTMDQISCWMHSSEWVSTRAVVTEEDGMDSTKDRELDPLSWRPEWPRARSFVLETRVAAS